MDTDGLSVGDLAPDFTLPDQSGHPLSLSGFRDRKNVIVVFFPFAFSGICTGELSGIRDHLEDFVADDLDVLAVSCDPTYALRAFADVHGYFFPLLSDFWPHGATARAYRVFHEAAGYALRGTFLLDTDQRVRFAQVNEAGLVRDFDPLHRAVAALRAHRHGDGTPVLAQ